ncbi:heavy metal-associated isoprenylated plant protein 41 [Triticum aestivum]|uniref:heavy metal-associated isoprenylated plant protein 41 n=1 Tax=Triticum aestivum TaxID=4565 RepID=UPI001D01821D|nr:heavy metal-associated isoprenylated plant protein 41-like [Triticum aestivum]
MAGASPESGAQNAAVKRVGHYSSIQTILLVGEGDLSFSRAIAAGFGSGANLVVTSLEDYDSLTDKYPEAKSNLAELEKLGAVILHGVDAHTMRLHPDLKLKRFDRILLEHQKVVKAFFESAGHLLRPYGEVHVSHKTKPPYDKWDLRRLAADSGLYQVKEAPFRAADYPGYNNKRGDGKDCDQPFMLGECSTFMFRKGYLNMIERPSHSLPLAPVWQGCHPYVPFNMYGMPPGSGFLPQYAAAQPGYALEYAPQQNSNMAGIMQQDQFSHQRMLIRKFGTHPC